MPQKNPSHSPRKRPSRAGFYDIYGERIPFTKIIGLCFAAGFVLFILIVAFIGNISLALKLGLGLFLAPIVIFWCMRFMLWIIDLIHGVLHEKSRPLRRKIRHMRHRKY